MTSPNISVIVLTYNAERYLPQLLSKLELQSVDFDLIIIDSCSTDSTQEILKAKGIDYHFIHQSDFNHGGTRNFALNFVQTEYVVYLTQDAIPVDEDAIKNLVAPIREMKGVVMSYGRQLPYPDATVLSSFARMTNYPDKSILKKKQLIPTLGIKTCHISNSFAAYDVAFLKEIGMFPTQCIMCEDVYAGAKAILADKYIYYAAEARVMHSHNYTWIEEFKRYFDIGVFYHSEGWILKNFSGAESEGLKYVRAEMLHLLSQRAFLLVPQAFFRIVGKYLGYLLGKYEAKIPLGMKRKLSMHRNFWNKNIDQL